MCIVKFIIAVKSFHCVYNVDETAIMFRIIPRHTHVLPGELKMARRFKGMKSKDLITLILVVNALASDEVPVCIIGHVANPHCFFVRQCPVHYQAQHNYLAENKRFSGWF